MKNQDKNRVGKFWCLYLIIAAEACWIAYMYMPVYNG